MIFYTKLFLFFYLLVKKSWKNTAGDATGPSQAIPVAAAMNPLTDTQLWGIFAPL